MIAQELCQQIQGGWETLNKKGRGTARSTRCHDSSELAASASAKACRTAGDHQDLALINFQSRDSSKYIGLKGSICRMQCCYALLLSIFCLFFFFPSLPCLPSFHRSCILIFWPSFQIISCPTPLITACPYSVTLVPWLYRTEPASFWDLMSRTRLCTKLDVPPLTETAPSEYVEQVLFPLLVLLKQDPLLLLFPKAFTQLPICLQISLFLQPLAYLWAVSVKQCSQETVTAPRPQLL